MLVEIANGRSAVHIRVHSSCGACGLALELHQPISAILHLPNAPVLAVHNLGPFTNRYDCSVAKHKRRLCQNRTCPANESAGESATLHTDCLQFALSNLPAGDGLHRLWTASTWRSAWRDAKPLPVATRPGPMDGTFPIGRIVGNPLLDQLPPELKDDIWRRVDNELFARYNAVWRLCQELRASEPAKPTSLPLSQVQSWSRGEAPVPRSSKTAAKVKICVTIDSRGISRIERGEAVPFSRDHMSNDSVYLIDDAETLENVTVDFKHGLGRLNLSPGLEHDLQLCMGYPHSIKPSPVPNRFFVYTTRRLQCPGRLRFIVLFPGKKPRQLPRQQLDWRFCYKSAPLAM